MFKGIKKPIGVHKGRLWTAPWKPFLSNL